MSSPCAALVHGFRRAIRFVGHDLWHTDPASLGVVPRSLLACLRVLHRVVRGFIEDECPLHATALTFSSVVAVVPILALALWVLKGGGAADLFEAKLGEALAGMPVEVQETADRVLTYVANTNFGTLGGIGLVVLIITVVMVLNGVEYAFNNIWGVRSGRPFLRKLADYLSIVVVVPILFIAATTVNASLSSQAFMAFTDRTLGPAAFLYRRVLSLLPWLVTWLAFIFMYKFIPSTRVKTSTAIVSGLIGGSLWMLWQLTYFHFQFGVARYNAIYGTLASVPVFLMWLFVSWEIVLFGVELGFAAQNGAAYGMEQAAAKANAESRTLLSLAIMADAAEAFMRGVAPVTRSGFAAAHRVPVRLVNEIVRELVEAGLLAEVEAGRNGGVVLLRPPERITAREVMEVVLRAGSDPAHLNLEGLRPRFQPVFERLDSALAGTLGRVTVRDLAGEATSVHAGH